MHSQRRQDSLLDSHRNNRSARQPAALRGRLAGARSVLILACLVLVCLVAASLAARTAAAEPGAVRRLPPVEDPAQAVDWDRETKAMVERYAGNNDWIRYNTASMAWGRARI